MSLLSVHNLKKYYSSGLVKKRHLIKALDGVSFDVKLGEVFGVIGESGCGKTTLGLVLSRLEKETDGEISFRGIKLSGKSKLDPDLRRQIQIIFQNPYESFDPRLSIEQSLILPMKINRICNSHSEGRERILAYMREAGFEPPESFLNRYSHELSGGQLQRISIVRAMLLRPSFLVADECVSMLDLSVRASVLNLLLDLVEREKTAVLFITHDLSLAAHVCDRIMVLYLGKVMELSTAKCIKESPLHPYTRVLMSYSPSIFRKKEKISIKRLQMEIVDGSGCAFVSRCPFSFEKCIHQVPDLFEIEPGHLVACWLYENQ
ncbi:hypothetical protein AS159_08880 [Thermotoga sp. Ku-13t]|uniref:oligopeptide/dipeptide ABC transporter ATP-binding protein n=1 Tax=Thermotoga sp. Ku-13t TaxID=1755813 RepID=UPI0013EC7359|nr:oligopeptide/dipeptide ABC transporter ATP-binding protein [Thermotoga sp. Ku-13t]KAF2957144.1 hypothetical protein AS159_08880 [Thermotoga sp. Ku-13t]